jgi:hypothetical protein
MLKGITLLAIENKRSHSTVAFIHGQLRSSLCIASVKRLTLRKAYLAAARRGTPVGHPAVSYVMTALRTALTSCIFFVV